LERGMGEIKYMFDGETSPIEARNGNMEGGR